MLLVRRVGGLEGRDEDRAKLSTSGWHVLVEGRRATGDGGQGAAHNRGGQDVFVGTPVMQPHGRGWRVEGRRASGAPSCAGQRCVLGSILTRGLGPLPPLLLVAGGEQLEHVLDAISEPTLTSPIIQLPHPIPMVPQLLDEAALAYGEENLAPADLSGEC